MGKHQGMLWCYGMVFYSKLVPKFKLRDSGLVGFFLEAGTYKWKT